MSYQTRSQHKSFAYSALYLAISVVPLVATAQAETTQQLNDVYVTGKKKVNRKDNEVTGLGKIVKNSDSISKEQVLGIRDLVRYDPGVTVVEQGRGASAGYSMRGVDKNRVALVVDGIPQTQSYVVQGYINGVGSSGGSINEVENENIASVEISKGASSAEYGSGSLGGAIGFRTKEPSDIIQGDRKWGLATKSAYSSKNEQYTNSIGFAGREGGFEGLVQYTYKKGKSTKIHKDALSTSDYSITRLGAYENIYDLREPNTYSAQWFLIKDEVCGTGACEPRAEALVSENIGRSSSNQDQPLSPEEVAQQAQAAYIKEKLSAKDYTGINRVMPDPMQYRTNSWLVKFGYHFNPQHYVGLTFEDTKQRYDIRNMHYNAYYTPNERRNFNGGGGVYRFGETPLSAVHLNGSVPIGLGWTRTQFFDENHTKRRHGIVYRYRGTENSFFDSVSLSFDKQDNTLDVLEHKRHCSSYPTVNKNCRPSKDKPWAYYNSERNKYSEHHNLVKFSLDKKFELFSTKHTVNLLTGLDHFKSMLSRSDYYSEHSMIDYRTVKGGNGTRTNPRIYEEIGRSVVTTDLCETARSAFSACGTRTIKGDNKFIALRDNVRVNKYLDIGLGGRYDTHRFRSPDPWTSNKDYKTFSWNLGVVAKPIPSMALSYRISNGFRVPSFQELFGFRTPGFEQGADDNAYKASNLKPERAMNQEFGIGFKGNFGSLEVSYFKSHYQNMITLARESLPIASYQYYNAQNVKLKGFNIVGKLDWNGVYDKLPEGLYSSLAYNRIEPKSIENVPGLQDIRSYVFDAVQPSRYIVGLGYDHPEDKWGLNAMMTYSKGKNPDELKSKRFNNLQNREQTINASSRTARSWYVFDLVGYVNVRDYLTLRAGVYNLMNYRYMTWESLRQSAAGSLNQHRNVENYARYAAPGRNFTLSLEMKF